MNKRIIIIVAILAVVIGVGAYFGLGKADREIESALRAELEKAGAQVESVKVSAISKEVELKNVTYGMELGGLVMQANVERAVVKGLNTDSFATEAQVSPPKVADAVTLYKGSVSMSPTDPSAGTAMGFTRYDVTFDEVTIEEWYQNLGALTELYTQGKWSPEFFREAYRGYLKDFRYKGYAATVEMPEFPGALEVRVEEMHMLKPAGYTDGKLMDTMSMGMSGMTMNLGDMGNATIASSEFHDFRFPTPEGMAEMMTLSEQLSTLTPADLENPDNPVMLAMLELLKREYAEKAPWSRFVVTGFHMDMAEQFGGESSSFDRLENTLEFGEAYTVALNGTGFPLPRDLTSMLNDGVAEAYLGQNPKVDSFMTLLMTPEAKGKSMISLGYEVPGLGKGQADMAVNIRADSLGAWLEVPDGAIQKTIFDQLDLNFDDSGLFAMLISSAAADRGVGFADAKADMSRRMGQALAGSGDRAPVVQEALATLMDKPGKLHIKVTANAEIPVASLFMAILFGMQGLDLEVDAQPGPKAMEEYVPASLR